MSAARALAAALGAGLAALAVHSAFAHGFGERYDLPIPLNFFLVGGAAAVALSFVVIGLFVRRQPDAFDYPRYDLLGVLRLRTSRLGRLALQAVRAASVAVLFLVVATAFFGTNKPIENLSPVFVWIIWWVGMAYAAALVGNVWMLLNPWKIAFEWGEKLLGGEPGERDAAMFRYPERWDVWPALLLFLAFAWLENVYSGASEPRTLGVLVVLYSLVTWAGMLAFGKNTWLRRGEAFSVLFGLFARFSPTEVEVADESLCERCGQDCGGTGGGCVDCYECFERAEAHQRRVNLRPYAVGLVEPGRVSTATAVFVVLALATVTFDGLLATPGWVDFQGASTPAASIFGVNALTAIDTVGLVLAPVAFLAVYMAFSWGIRRLSGEQVPVVDVAKGFVFSLIPIAIAYNLAHFLSLLLIQGQLIVPLVSDPFGFGWDLFGTAGYRLNIGVIGAKFTWYLSVAAIVLGHVISVYVAHVVSLRRTPSHDGALRGQYPMLLLMVLYTATSLWIIAQPIMGS